MSKFSFFNVLFPQICPCCKELVDSNNGICSNCRNSISKNPQLVLYSFQDKKRTPLKCSSPFIYEDKIKTAIHNFKFKKKLSYAKIFAYEQYLQIKKDFGNIPFDIITFVPMSKKKQSKRGFNQTELLAKKLSKYLNIPCKSVLITNKEITTQHFLNREQRFENILGVYDINPKVNIKNKNILLCDDITTTGATLSECSKVLLSNGAYTVFCTTIATTENRDIIKQNNL